MSASAEKILAEIEKRRAANPDLTDADIEAQADDIQAAVERNEASVGPWRPGHEPNAPRPAVPARLRRPNTVPEAMRMRAEADDSPVMAGLKAAGEDLAGNLGAYGRGGAQALTLGTADELAGVGRVMSHDSAPRVMMGKGGIVRRPADPPAEAMDLYRGGRDEWRAGDDKAARERPLPFYGGMLTGAVRAPTAVGAAASPVGKVGVAIGEGMATAAGDSRADLTKGTDKDWDRFGRDVIQGGGTAALIMTPAQAFARRAMVPKAAQVDAAGDLISPAQPSTMERLNYEQTMSDATKGAVASSRRRAVPNEQAGENIMSLAERDPGFKKALPGDRGTLSAVASQRAGKARGQAEPIYTFLDDKKGFVPKNEIADQIQKRIDELGNSYDQNEKLIKALEDSKADLLRSRAKDPSIPDQYTERVESRFEPKAPEVDDYTGLPKGSVGGEPPKASFERVDSTVTDVVPGEERMRHQDLREWVTGYLKQKKAQMGGINETLASQWREELHSASDAALRSRLQAYAAESPEMAEQVSKLFALNIDISAATSVSKTAKNAREREGHAKKPFGERAKEVGKRTALATVPALAGYHYGGPAIAAGAFLGGIVAPEVLKGMSRVAIDKLGTIARQARMGKVDAIAKQEALTAGVPADVIKAVIVSGNRPGPANPAEAMDERRRNQQ